jgi:hypothetical protein
MSVQLDHPRLHAAPPEASDAPLRARHSGTLGFTLHTRLSTTLGFTLHAGGEP